MKVYDEPPAEWAEAKAKEKVAEAAKPKSTVGGIIKDEAIGAAKKTADLPRRAFRLAAGLDRPQSMDDYQMMALMTTPVMGGAGNLATRIGLPNLVGQMGAAGAIGGGQAMVRGEDPTFPALADAATTGVFGGAVPKIAGAVAGKFAKPAVAREASEATRAATQVQRGQIEGAGKMLEQGKTAAAEKIGRDVGWLLPELETFHANELWGMAKEWGPAQIRRAFSSALGPVEDRLASAINTYRTASTAGPPKLTVPTLSKQPIALDTAVEGLIEAGKESRGAVRNEILASLRVLDPSGRAGDLFTQAMKIRAAGYTYANTIKQGLDKSGNLDPEKLAGFINKNADKLRMYAGDYWPELEKILLGGQKAPVPVGDVKLPSMPNLPKLAPEPSGLARAARAGQRIAGDPSTRAGLSAGNIMPLGESGTTAGAATIAATPVASILKHVPGGKMVLDRAGVEEGE